MPTSVYGSGGLLVAVPWDVPKWLGKQVIQDVFVVLLALHYCWLAADNLSHGGPVAPHSKASLPGCPCWLFSLCQWPQCRLQPAKGLSWGSSWGLVGGPLENNCLYPNLSAPAGAGPKCCHGLLMGCDSLG